MLKAGEGRRKRPQAKIKRGWHAKRDAVYSCFNKMLMVRGVRKEWWFMMLVGVRDGLVYGRED